MGTTMSGTYVGGKSFKLLHHDSGATITTDAPKDNNGEGTSFSPTDLCSVSLPACMCTVMTIYADQNGLDLTGMTFSVEKVMTKEPRRIGELRVSIDLPATVPTDHREAIERTALECPVHRSLDPEIAISIEFQYR